MFRLGQRTIRSTWSRTLFGLRNIARSTSKTCCNRKGIGCHSDNVTSGQGGMLSSTPVQWDISNRQYCTSSFQLTEAEYEEVADETLDSLSEMFEDLPERFDLDPDYDVTFNSGVLTVKISPSWGTYVINKQTPNKQIWFSSPISGPKRYDFEDGVWIYKHDGGLLHELLNTEISEAIGRDVDFKICSFAQKV